MKRLVHESANIIIQRFGLSIVEQKQSFNCWQLLMQKFWLFVYSWNFWVSSSRNVWSIIPGKLSSAAPGTCSVSKSETFSSVFNLFIEMRPTWFNCWTLIVCTSKCFALRPGSKPLHNGFGDFNFGRSCSLVFKQVFHVQLASKSAEDSDTVTCVTDQCRTVKNGPIANTPPDVDNLDFWVSSPVCIHGHMDDNADILWGNVRFSSIFCLWGCVRSCCLWGFPSYWKQCRSVVLSYTGSFQHLIGTKIGPVLEITTSCLYGKHGIEIRIWSLSEDNTHSWVRISHGPNKYVMDSNYNNTEVPADLPEEQALQPIVKVFAARSKAKAKPQRREPVDLPSIIPMNERKWIDIEPGDSSLSAYEISKKVTNLLRHSQTVQREDDGAVQFWKIKNFLQNQFPQVPYWSHDRWKMFGSRRSKKKISVLHWYFRNNYLSTSSSRTFRT